ncbi:centrosome-associated protein 350-like [Rhopilema esculentum]|uniref:centrosome-associated protein 350-like n=1 Tax=Rhopilema esculentum TaxID=499914 RepID=UPI0031CEF700
MAVNFQSRSATSKKFSPEYKTSLSAIENVWSNIASTKENLDDVDRRIRTAGNIDDIRRFPPSERVSGPVKKGFTRKYSKPKKGKVVIDPNPTVKYKEPEGDYEYEESDNFAVIQTFNAYRSNSENIDQFVPRRIPLLEDQYGFTAKSNIKDDFDYDPDDVLVNDRPITPKVPRLDTSGSSRKSLLGNIKDSGALQKIRDKIRQQKENLANLDLEAFPSKSRHYEDDPVVAIDTRPKEPMKRKTASSSSTAPTYKGFNLPRAKENAALIQTTAEAQNRRLATHKERKERVGLDQPRGKPLSKSNARDRKKGLKKDLKRSPGKMQRIVAAQKPVPSISTTSWRVGQEAVKKVMQAMKDSKISEVNKEKGKGAQLKDKANDFEKEKGGQDGYSDHDDDDGLSEMEDEDTKTKDTDARSAQMSGDYKTDSARSENTESKTAKSSERGVTSHDDLTDATDSKSGEEEDLKKISEDLRNHEDLPEEAKSMLADLEMDSSADENDPFSKDEPVNDIPVKKSPTARKRIKRKAGQTGQNKDEAKSSKSKIRHYNQEEIQNYMAKQLAERKRRRMQEKRRQQQLKFEQEQKLKELYMKQKTNLRASISVRQSKLMGSTFTKSNKGEDWAKLSQDKFESDTAMKLLRDDNGVSLNETGSGRQDDDVNVPPISPPVGESSKRDVSGDELDDSVADENEERFKDSLEFEKIENDMYGISVTVRKTGTDSPVEARSEDEKPKSEPFRSVEEEVRDLLEKYKSSRQPVSRPPSVTKVGSLDPAKMSKAERIAAISATATSLRERLAAEANRLANLRVLANKEKPPAASPVPLSGFSHISEFRGVLPGTASIHEQAKTNEELLAKEEAATRIQAAYRGHSIRQGLTWKLPSGKTLAATMREAREKTTENNLYRQQLTDRMEPSSVGSYSSAFEASSAVDAANDKSVFSDKTSTMSLIKESKRPSPAKSQRPKFESLRGKQTKVNEDSFLKNLTGKAQEKKGDRYSVINIYTRRLKEASKRHLEEEGAYTSPEKKEKEDFSHIGHDSLQEQHYDDADFDSFASTIKSESENEDNEVDTLADIKGDEGVSKTRSSQKPSLSNEDSHEETSEDLDKTLTLLPEDVTQKEASEKIHSYNSDADESITSHADDISPARSLASLTDGSVDFAKDPVMSSTMRNPSISHAERRALNEQDSSLTTTSAVTEKFSPGTLERKLRAEVNQLETMDDALRQVTDIERVRGVSLAQQETVSLAQILKARQLGYKQEMERMSKDANEQATRNAEQVATAKEAAMKATESVNKTLAEIRAQAAETVAESTRRLEEVQKEAAKRAEEAAEKVEKAQKMASDVAIESANRHSNDVQTMATNAAAAAASSAVQAAMQFHREQLEQLRNEALKKVSKSYSQSTFSSTSTRSTDSDQTLTNSTEGSKKSSSRDISYKDDDFEEPSPQKSSITEKIKSKNEATSSIVEESLSRSLASKKSFTPTIRESIGKSIAEDIRESIKQSLESSGQDNTNLSRTSEIGTEYDKHSTPARENDKLRHVLDESLQHSEIEEQSFKIDDNLGSSLTEDELDSGFRMVLPVMSHRRKSLEKEKRSKIDKLLSDNGTSSDDGKLSPESASKLAARPPFAGEDTFTKFTDDMVRQYIQEEEIRSKHQTALLKLREKALIEKAKAEMAWLEMQKTSLKSKGADDLMPPLNKKQRGLWMKLKSEQSEIRRLKQAYRAASHERRFMLYQQKEIVRLKDETQKIWSRLGQVKVAKSQEKSQESMENGEKSVSEVSSIGSVDQTSVVSDGTANNFGSVSSANAKQLKSQSSYTKTKTMTSPKTPSTAKSAETTAEVPEEIPTEVHPATDGGSFPTYTNATQSPKMSDASPESHTSSRQEEAESTADEVSITEHTQSSMVTDLKKLRKKASEQYLRKRERTLKDRRSQFESALKNQREIADWQKRIELEELRLKADIKRALDKSKNRNRVSPTPSKSAREDRSESSESTTIKSQTNSASRTSSTKSMLSKDKSSESDTSQIEEIKMTSNETDNDIIEESIASVSPGIQKSSDTSIPEEYGEDTFESPSGTRSQSKKMTSVSEAALSLSLQGKTKKRHTKESDESKSEEEVSLADATSDASDIEKRIGQLEDELLKRRRDLDRIRRKREKDQLRKQEQKLQQELQAVESMIQQENKENLHGERSLSESNSFIKGPVSPKIMSPKILQPVSQHEQAGKKPVKDKGTKSLKSDELQTRKEPDLAQKIASRVIEQVKEKTSKESSPDKKARSLSEEVDALRRLSEKSSDIDDVEEAKAKSRSEENATSDEEEKTLSVETDKSVTSKSQSYRSNVSYSSSRDLISSKESSIASRENHSLVRTVSEKLSVAKDSPKADIPEDSFVEEQSLADQSDSLRSISESIFSEKSLQEEEKSRKSHSHSERLPSQKKSEKSDRSIDIYKDDFFETSSSVSSAKTAKSLASETRDKDVPGVEASSDSISDLARPEVEDEEKSMRTATISSDVSQSSLKEYSSQALSRFEGFRVNDRVLIDGMLKGTIRYIGRVSFSPVVVAGVELDEAVGNSDGAFRGKRYFTCSSDCGLFSPVANISHLESKSDERSAGRSAGRSAESERSAAKRLTEKSDQTDSSLSESIKESIRTDIDEEMSQRSEERSQRSDRISQRSEGKSQRSSRALSMNSRSLRGEQKEFSYKEDFEDEGKISTDKEVSYGDDFDETEAKEDRAIKDLKDKSPSKSVEGSMPSGRSKVGERSPEKETQNDSISERFSIVNEDDEESQIVKDELKPFRDSFKEDGSLRDEVRPSSPLTLSEIESSDAEAVPLPPRVDLNQLAESLTEGLLKKLLAESLAVASPLLNQDPQDLESYSQLSEKKGHQLSAEVKSKDSGEEVKDKKSPDDISEELPSSISEKSDDTIKRMIGHAPDEGFDANDMEVSEVFVSPARGDKLLDNDVGIARPNLPRDAHSLEKSSVPKDEGSTFVLTAEASVATDKEVSNVSQTLLYEAIAQMAQIFKQKKAKLLLEDQSKELQHSADGDVRLERADDVKPIPKAAKELPKMPGSMLGDLPMLSTSPPESQSPNEFDLNKPTSAIDTDLLAAKLSELKRMDQEIDDLLGDDDSDDDEPFAPIGSRSIPSLDSDEPGLMPPVRVFDFGEPIIYVPNKVPDIRQLVSDSANIVDSNLAVGQDYDEISPDEQYLRNDIETLESELETTSKKLFKRMIFDVTKDLLKEVHEFKEFQKATKEPFSKPNRRVFPKFIRQVHHLVGEELVETLENHVCVCLGLKNGRPSLDVLKKRLPLNTAKKDYIDAILVEELREEEPQWVNYDEDEVCVKDQLTEGILENLLTETILVLNDIESKRTL